MAVNKVIYADRELINLTEDTVTPETLAEGVTAHDKSGEPIVGTMKASEDLTAVLDEQENLISELQDALRGKGSAWYDAFWDAYQDYGNAQRCAYMFAGCGWTEKTFKPKYALKMIEADHMFSRFNCNPWNLGAYAPLDFTGYNDMFDFSGATSVNYTFQNARIKNLIVDISAATSAVLSFASGNGGDLNNLTIKVTNKLKTYNNTFAYQSRLFEIRFTDGSEIDGSVDFKSCTQLSRESVMNIVPKLSDAASGKTVTFSKTAVTTAFGGIDTEELLALEAMKPNWTFAYS